MIQAGKEPAGYAIINGVFSMVMSPYFGGNSSMMWSFHFPAESGADFYYGNLKPPFLGVLDSSEK